MLRSLPLGKMAKVESKNRRNIRIGSPLRNWKSWKATTVLATTSCDPGSAPRPLRGEIWLVEAQRSPATPGMGSRKVIVMSRDSLLHLPWRLVIPISPWQEQDSGQFWKVPLEDTSRKGQPGGGVAETLHVTTIRLDRFLERVGVLGAERLQDLAATVALAVGHQ